MKKVILISIDGMRPDGLVQCGNPFVKELEKRCAYTYSASSVMPSVTFPCHFSMSHSVLPERHGLLTNTYVPQVRPVKGLFELIKEKGGKSVMTYGWENIRDIASPGSLGASCYVNAYAEESTDTVLTDKVIELIDRYDPDFTFHYMVETDDKGGHDSGWMSEEYLKRISIAIDNVKRLMDKYSSDHTFIIMADHGGHGRMHGTDLPEDMTIPLLFCGEEFVAGKIEDNISLLEIAPTIAKIMSIEPDRDWDGRSII